jgi:hypothetical protein
MSCLERERERERELPKKKSGSCRKLFNGNKRLNLAFRDGEILCLRISVLEF